MVSVALGIRALVLDASASKYHETTMVQALGRDRSTKHIITGGRCEWLSTARHTQALGGGYLMKWKQLPVLE
jgi:hypothetical protein